MKPLYKTFLSAVGFEPPTTPLSVIRAYDALNWDRPKPKPEDIIRMKKIKARKNRKRLKNSKRKK